MKITRLERAKINASVNIRELYERAFNDLCGVRSIFCPFHADREGGHKSAVILDDVNIIYCFSRRRAYTSYDFLVKVLKEDPRLYLDNVSLERVQKKEFFTKDLEQKVLKDEITMKELVRVLQDKIVEDEERE